MFNKNESAKLFPVKLYHYTVVIRYQSWLRRYQNINTFEGLAVEPPKKKVFTKEEHSADCTGESPSLEELELVTGRTLALFFTHVSFVKLVILRIYEFIKDLYMYLQNTVISTPHILSTFMVINDLTQRYFAIQVCTGYYK